MDQVSDLPLMVNAGSDNVRKKAGFRSFVLYLDQTVDHYQN